MMQWWKKLKNFISVLFEPDIVNDFIDNGKPYETIPRKIEFMEGSVNGDYRIYPLKDGFCAAWGDSLVARKYDGSLLWKSKGWARALAMHPDGDFFVAVYGKSICLFNTSSGNPLREAVELDVFIDFIYWLDKKRIIASDGKKLLFFNAHVEIIDIIDGIVNEDGFLGGIAIDNSNSNFVTILDVNNHQLKKIDIEKKLIVLEREAEYADQLFFNNGQSWIWTTVVNGTHLQEIRVYESRKLIERFALPFNAKKGVRSTSQKPKDLSFHSYVPLPSLSPLRQYFLVNDNSGLLWLIDARTGDKRRVFRRNLLDFVLHTHWIDNEHFIAILEGGYVAKMNIRGRKVDWKVYDFD